ncbi:MAG: HIT family protein [Gammaproteobacteria bacterium]|nr:HIT family protein [Rhodocyclaceae bacterium]MBU3908066.1 HIT family protein [Gammaproteobacteria bacterium]MBU3990323.1 HIT family protein [Gammaproteobacteria bacterium]MBU4006023.1 HIT family protein [Gammaproteobacteria bacterium]MBU4022004.1 HIT family protein [Gammaproteobacteria bacterium]
MNACELCDSPGGEILWQDDLCRVIRVSGSEADAFPGFCRVIWQAHARELSDLTVAERRHLLDVVAATEAAVRAVARPDKINLASLGNVVPHLHWHVIPRWADDSHFPAPIWATAMRPLPIPPLRPQPESAELRKALVTHLGESP